MRAELMSTVDELNEIAALTGRMASLSLQIDRFDEEKQEEEQQIISACADRLSEYQEQKEEVLKKAVPKKSKLLETVMPGAHEPSTIKNPFHDLIYGTLVWAALILCALVWVILCITESSNYLLIFGSIFGGILSIILLLKGAASKLSGLIQWMDEDDAWQSARNTWIQQIEQIDAKADGERLDAEWAAYENAFFAFVKDCNRQYDKEIEFVLSEKEKLAKRSLKKLEEIDAALAKTNEALASKTVLHPSFHYLASEIASMLVLGRADNMTDAINLAVMEDNQRKEAAERRAAEDRRAAMQAAEARRHNEAMEREAREAAIAERQHQERMAREAHAQTVAAEHAAAEAARQARAAENAARQEKWRAEQQARDARREEHRAHTAAMHRCSSCVNSAKCSASVKNNPNCAAYRPR